MFGNRSHQPENGGRSFLSTLVLGSSLVVVALIGSTAAVAIYAMNIIDRKTGNIFEFAEVTIQSLPELAASLPPILADIVNDERRPDYADQLDVSVKLSDSGSSKGLRPLVVIHNGGNKVVTLMSMRIVVLNDRDEPITETNEWGATPIAADDDWRGPLLPGATRRFSVGCWFVGKSFQSDNLRVEFEITDLRVWNGDNADAVVLTSATN